MVDDPRFRCTLLPFIKDTQVLTSKNLIHGFSTRLKGVSPHPFDTLNLGFSGGDAPERVIKNREIFFSSLGIDPGKIFLTRQVHGNRVFSISEQVKDYEALKKRASQEACDALITNQTGIPLTVLTADCVPLIIWDPVQRAIGVVHAGWRGTLQRVTEVTLQAMATTFHTYPKDCRVVIGPSIRSCCYEVGEMVVEPFKATFSYASCLIIQKGNHRWLLDLAQANRQQLIRSGVCEENISTLNYCTYCRSDLFFSYRRDGKRTGRMLSTAMLLAD